MSDVADILQKRPATPTLKNHAIRYLQEKTRSFEYTRSVLRVIERQTRAEIERLGGNAGLGAILDSLSIPDDTA